MNAVIEEIYAAQAIEGSARSGKVNFCTAVQFESGRLLYELVSTQACRRTLEVGLAYGLSTLFICQAHEDRGEGHHIAIDPRQEAKFESKGLHHLERAGLRERVQFFEAPSYAVLPELLADRTSLDFAFIDGRHLFDFALVDFFYIDLMLEVGGHVAFDDLWMPGVRKMVNYVLRNRAYELVRPSSTETSLRRRIERMGRRYLQNPLGRDGSLKRYPLNTALLRKCAPDDRRWDFHRSF